MFKCGDIVRYNKKIHDFKMNKSILIDKFIVVSTNNKDKQLSMVDYNDHTMMRLGDYDYLEVDIPMTRKIKVKKLIDKINNE